MQFTREINRLLFGLLISFFVIVLAAARWAVFGAESVLQREDNPRLVIEEASIQRGSIYDRNDRLLAVTFPREASFPPECEPYLALDLFNVADLFRCYPYPAAFSAVGYYSLVYGVSGAESAYDSLLRGDREPETLSSYFDRDILHLPQQGSDVQLTLDLSVQTQVAAAMGNQRGAVVVIAVPGGEVLTLLSQPGVDPNTLERDWEMLVADAGKPFFNRALQGGYQPGALLQLPLLSLAISSNQPPNRLYDAATAPVLVEDVEVACLTPTVDTALTLRDAFLAGCPQAFVMLAQEQGVDAVQAQYVAFRLDRPPTLPGFVVEPPLPEATPTAAAPAALPVTPEAAAVLQPNVDVTLTEENFLPNVVGQGTITVTPLEMALLVAAPINGGNAPQPIILRATRAPGTTDWMSARRTLPSAAVMTGETSLQVQSVLRENVATGSASAAQQPGLDIGGQVAVAYSGESTQAWFIGFATLPDGTGFATAVILENSADFALAARIGGTALTAAHTAAGAASP